MGVMPRSAVRFAFAVVSAATVVSRVRGRVPAEAGKYNVTNTSFFAMKFYKVGSETVQLALYHAVGIEAGYMEHHSLSEYRAHGVAGLMCIRPPRPRVVLMSVFREPVSRFLSALRMAPAALHVAETAEEKRTPCAARSVAYYTARRDYFFANSKVMPCAQGLCRTPHNRTYLPHYISWEPYATVFGAQTADDVPAVLTHVEANFIVGVTEAIDGYFDLLTRAFHLDPAATRAYGGAQRFENAGLGHVVTAKSYCSVSRTPPDVVKGLADLMPIDTAIYEGVRDIYHQQLDLPADALPWHDASGVTCPSKSRHRTTLAATKDN